jgi:Cu+-exporting ATPase
LAASLEYGSEHPLANAIVKGAEQEKIILQRADNFQSITGKGVVGIFQNRQIAFGNAKLMESFNISISALKSKAQEFHRQGHTVMFLAIDGELSGLLTVMDTIKPHSKRVIDSLKKTGLDIIMLTGDNRQTAIAIAEQLGIDRIEAEILPNHKYEYIALLQKGGRKVAMAGDGINDAPALTQANVGIAMGTGADIAIESADVTLMSGDLVGILKAKCLSHFTMQNIRQNLFLAFIYNTLAIPIAAGLFYPIFGLLLNPMIASAAMALSSLSVIANALRLSKVKLSDEHGEFYVR